MSVRDLIAEVVRVAGELSADSAGNLAVVIATADAPEALRTRARSLGTPRQRQILESIATRWATEPTVTGSELATALVAAQEAHEAAIRREHVELIWTGPRPQGSVLRRTDQALFEVIDRAVERLLLVTYTAYDVPILSQRLIEATARGVAIRLVLESAAEQGGKVSFDPFTALRVSVPAARLYRWPPMSRPMDMHGNTGALHAKCAVVDGKLAFISSANLTGSAFEANMELGVLIEGVEIASGIEHHFDRLISEGVLEVVSQR